MGKSKSYHVRYNRTTSNGEKRLYMREFETERIALNYARGKALDLRNKDVRAFEYEDIDGVTHVHRLTF